MIILPTPSEFATLQLAGGKGANLSRLAQLGLQVPPAFIITTTAYNDYVRNNGLQRAIDAALAGVNPAQPQSLQTASEAIYSAFRAGILSVELHHLIVTSAQKLGQHQPLAVRSSATAEDLPEASFAGQQDTFLNVIGEPALLQAVVDCWASLYSARAIGYRARNQIAHNTAAVAVILQQMVPSEVSGVLFTANPLSGLRSQSVIDATFGLGEALVGGVVEPDHYEVNTADGVCQNYQLGSKAKVAIAKNAGGIELLPMRSAERRTLTDQQLSELAQLGRSIETAFGSPQDIEFAYANGKLHLLQSRPITSLFPIPFYQTQPLSVWFSFGAVQGLVGAITPLGQESIKRVVLGVAQRYGSPTTLQDQDVFASAGERLWVKVDDVMRSPVGSKVITSFMLGFIEPGSAEVVKKLSQEPSLMVSKGPLKLSTLRGMARFLLPVIVRVPASIANPRKARAKFDADLESYLNTIKIPGEGDRFERLRAFLEFYEAQGGLAEALPTILPIFLRVFAPAMGALNLLNKLAGGSVDGFSMQVMQITRGIPNNVTTQMDLALWQTARAIKQDPESLAVFENNSPAQLAQDLLVYRLPQTAQLAIRAFLEHYGMRGVGEIDLGQPRWREAPEPLLGTLQGYLRISDENAPDAVFAKGEAAAEEAIASICRQVGVGPLGWLRKKIVRAAALRVRELIGVRESPKFTAIRAMGQTRQVLLAIGAQFVAAGTLAAPDDLFYLYGAELKQLAAAEQEVDWQMLVKTRRETFARENRRTLVPRMIVSDGRAFYDGVGSNGSNPDLQDGRSLIGSPVSAGVTEGLVRVVLDPRGTQLQAGEILVCPGTDPAWTPLFMLAAGLVTEVGGMMTHGSVVAREYGIPAVVGVSHATLRLRTGQRIRLDGSTGVITLLDEAG